MDTAVHIARAAGGTKIGAVAGAVTGIVSWITKRMKLGKKLRDCPHGECMRSVMEEIKHHNKNSIRQTVIATLSGAGLGTVGGAINDVIRLSDNVNEWDLDIAQSRQKLKAIASQLKVSSNDERKVSLLKSNAEKIRQHIDVMQGKIDVGAGKVSDATKRIVSLWKRNQH